MNAKFEKWARDNGYIVQPGRDGYLYSYMGTEEACKGWNGAIQSLEVTPDLVEMANNVQQQFWDDHKLSEFIDSRDYTESSIEAVLEAVLSALKEQAK